MENRNVLPRRRLVVSALLVCAVAGLAAKALRDLNDPLLKLRPLIRTEKHWFETGGLRHVRDESVTTYECIDPSVVISSYMAAFPSRAGWQQSRGKDGEYHFSRGNYRETVTLKPKPKGLTVAHKSRIVQGYEASWIRFMDGLIN
jgi:hypothetical protein